MLQSDSYLAHSFEGLKVLDLHAVLAARRLGFTGC
jgi:hypothetical protein